MDVTTTDCEEVVRIVELHVVAREESMESKRRKGSLVVHRSSTWLSTVARPEQHLDQGETFD